MYYAYLEYKNAPNVFFVNPFHRYVPEGEEDLVRIELLLHPMKNVFLFIWKTFEKNDQAIFIRYKKVTWKLMVDNSCIFQFEFCTSNNVLSSKESPLEKIVGWPEQKHLFQTILNSSHMTKVAQNRYNTNKINDFLKWFSKTSKDYLDEMNMDVEQPLECGRTLLHYAARMENTAYLKALIHKFQSVDVIDAENNTPLHVACAWGNYNSMKILLEANANANLINSNGFTCLMIISKRKIQDTKLIKLLLKNYASCDMENKDGMRAIDYARQISKTSPIIPLLQKRSTF